ncbi:phasin family protein [Massilia sp. IC2-278]|uniref:phasin family protein n=1 Tax=Massilia sp. IC2-278 TaxID=2887200 RepID=UPI001E627A10|nr:phasin family protein [Massilia sp. IC2-278]MCC2963339.1 phasin family protein [Massilia sp. IC2-278]
MTSLPEQFQAARQTQLDRQFAFLRSLGDGVLDRTSRVFALNLDLSRATAEHSSNAMRQLLAVRDPRDLLTIGAQSQRQLRTLFDYGHELFNIAAGLRGAALQTYAVEAAADAPALAAPLALAESIAESAAEPVAESVQQAMAASETFVNAAAEATAERNASPVGEATAPDTAAAPVSVSAADVVLDPIAVSDIVPPVEPTPIARATSDILDVPLAPPHPVAASVPVDVDVEIELPKVEPIEATPPVAAPSNGAPKVTEIRSGRGRKKNS